MQKITGKGQKPQILFGKSVIGRGKRRYRGKDTEESESRQKTDVRPRTENVLGADCPDYRTCPPDVRTRIVCALESLLPGCED